MKSIKEGLKISPDLPRLHRDFCYLANEISKLSTDESKEFKSQIDEILKGKSVFEYNDEYLKNSKSLSKTLAASEVLFKLDSSKVEEIQKLILASNETDCHLKVSTFIYWFNFFF